MNIFDTIHSGCCYRGDYLNETPSEEDIQTIIEAALAAPARVNIRTTSYIVVTDTDLLQALHKTTKLPLAPLAILALSEDIPNKLGRNFQDENFAVAAQNILLAVTALGYATCLNDTFFNYSQLESPVRKLLNIPRNKKIKAIFNIGKPVAPVQPIKAPMKENCVQFNAF